MKKLRDASGWVIIIAFLASCSTTNKTKSITKTSIDSVSIVKVDSAVAKTIDSISVKKANVVTTVDKVDDYVKETVIEYEPTPSGVKADDYFPVIKKTTIKETGVKKERTSIIATGSDSTKLVNTDNTALVKSVETDLQKTEFTKDKHIERTSYWGWLWLLLLIPAYVIYRNWDKIKLALKIV